MSAVVTLALGALGAVIAWVGLEFVGKPVRAFFDLKRESLEALTLYGNVGARTKQLVLKNDDGLMSFQTPAPPSLSPAEKRLRDAEDAFRLFGSRFHAFAQTEKFAVIILRLLRFNPGEAGLGFIGLSNSIGEYGQTRNENRKLIERSLKATV